MVEPSTRGYCAMNAVPASAAVATDTSVVFAASLGIRREATAAAVITSNSVESKQPAHVPIPVRIHRSLPPAHERSVGPQSLPKHRLDPYGPISTSKLPEIDHQRPAIAATANADAATRARPTISQRCFTARASCGSTSDGASPGRCLQQQQIWLAYIEPSPERRNPGDPLPLVRGLLIAAPLLVLAGDAPARTFEGSPSTSSETAQPASLLVRVKLGVRDLFADTLGRLSTLAPAAWHVPDLTVLTTQPLGDSPSTWATSGFGWREDPIRKRRKWHSGADVRAKRGTPVSVAGDGVVVFAGRQGGYGNVVYVDHGGGVITRYGHLSRIFVKKHASLVAGQELGRVGSTGRATGPHLHFEVRVEGRPVDPATAMTVGAIQRESPETGVLAAFALSPELQALSESELDPPRTRVAKAKGTRPERKGRTRIIRPVS